MQLKGAIIGFGKIVINNHLPAFEMLEDKVKITSVVEVNDNYREKVKKEYPGLNFYKTLDELLSNEEIDFIDIATPPKFHKFYLEKGVENNLNVICEKPLIKDSSGINEIKELFSDKKLVFFTCHQYKNSPLWKEFKKLADSIKDDKIIIQLNIFRVGADPGIGNSGNIWRLDKEVGGGGILSDTGFHYLYLANWFMNSLPKKVTAKNFNLAHPEFNVEDTSFLNLEYNRGVIQINLTWANNGRKNDAKLLSKGGAIYYNGDEVLRKVINDEEIFVKVPNASDKSHYTKLYSDLFNDFISSILSKDFSGNQLNEAINTVKLLDLCYKSDEMNKTIEIIEY